MEALGAGTIVGNWRLVQLVRERTDELKVWLAEEVEGERNSTVKIALAGHDSALKREAKVLQALQAHTCAPCLLWEGNSAPFYVVVTQHLRGETVKALRARNRWLPGGVCIDLAKAMVTCAREVHSEGFAICSVTPAAFIFAAPGDTSPVLASVANARPLTGEDASPPGDAEALDQLLFGPPGGRGAAAAGRRDDLWGVLYTFLHLLLGELPWEAAAKDGDSAAVTAAKLSNEAFTKSIPVNIAISTLKHKLTNLPDAETPDYDGFITTLEQMRSAASALDGEQPKPFHWLPLPPPPPPPPPPPFLREDLAGKASPKGPPPPPPPPPPTPLRPESWPEAAPPQAPPPPPRLPSPPVAGSSSSTIKVEPQETRGEAKGAGAAAAAGMIPSAGNKADFSWEERLANIAAAAPDEEKQCRNWTTLARMALRAVPPLPKRSKAALTIAEEHNSFFWVRGLNDRQTMVVQKLIYDLEQALDKPVEAKPLPVLAFSEFGSVREKMTASGARANGQEAAASENGEPAAKRKRHD